MHAVTGNSFLEKLGSVLVLAILKRKTQYEALGFIIISKIKYQKTSISAAFNLALKVYNNAITFYFLDYFVHPTYKILTSGIDNDLLSSFMQIFTHVVGTPTSIKFNKLFCLCLAITLKLK